VLLPSGVCNSNIINIVDNNETVFRQSAMQVSNFVDVTNDVTT